MTKISLIGATTEIAHETARFYPEGMGSVCYLIVWGLFKKIVIVDTRDQRRFATRDYGGPGRAVAHGRLLFTVTGNISFQIRPE